MTDTMKKIKEMQNVTDVAIVDEVLKQMKQQMGLTEEKEKERSSWIVEQGKRNGKIGDFTIVEIPIELLNIDMRYQRTETFDVVRANRIARKFQKSELDPIHISYRDGKFYIVDGQHRVYAFILMKKGYITGRLDTMTFFEEVRAFMHQHEDKKLSPYDLYKAGLAIGDPVDETLQYLSEEYHVEITKGRSRKGKSVLQSITTAKEIITREGGGCLEWIFKVIHDSAWDVEPCAYSSSILRMMYQLYGKYSQSWADRKTLVSFYKSLTPNSLLYMAKTKYPTRGEVSAMYTVCIDYVNDSKGNKEVKEVQNNVVPSVEDKVFVLKNA